MAIVISTNTKDKHSAARIALELQAVYNAEFCFFKYKNNDFYHIVIQASNIEIAIHNGGKPGAEERQQQYLQGMQSVITSHEDINLTNFRRQYGLIHDLPNISNLAHLASQFRLNMLFHRKESAKLTSAEFSEKLHYAMYPLNNAVAVISEDGRQLELRIDKKGFLNEIDAFKLKDHIKNAMTKLSCNDAFDLMTIQSCPSSFDKEDYKIRGHVEIRRLKKKEYFDPIFLDNDAKERWISFTSRAEAISMYVPFITMNCQSNKCVKKENTESELLITYKAYHPNDSFMMKGRNLELDSDIIGGTLENTLRSHSRRYTKYGQDSRTIIAISFSDITFDSSQLNLYETLFQQKLSKLGLDQVYQLQKIERVKGDISAGTKISLTNDKGLYTLPTITNKLENRLLAAGYPIDKLPKEFTCSLSEELMQEPARLASSPSRANFDTRQIALHTTVTTKCPLTRQPVRKEDVMPNLPLRSQILTFIMCIEYLAEKALPFELANPIVEMNYSLYWLKEQQGDGIASISYQEAGQKALAHYKVGELREAIYCFELAEKKYCGLPDDRKNDVTYCSILYNLASAYLYNEQLDQAIDRLENLKTLEGKLLAHTAHIKHQTRLAKAYYSANKKEEADSTLQDILTLIGKLKPVTSTEDYLSHLRQTAFAYSTENEFEQADAVFKKLFSECPSSLRSMFEYQARDISTHCYWMQGSHLTALTKAQALWKGQAARKKLFVLNAQRDFDNLPKNSIKVSCFVIAPLHLFQEIDFTSRSSHDPFHGLSIGNSIFHGELEFNSSLYSHFGGAVRQSKPDLHEIIETKLCKDIAVQTKLGIMSAFSVEFLHNGFGQVVSFDLIFYNFHTTSATSYLKFLDELKQLIKSFKIEGQPLFSYNDAKISKFDKEPLALSQAALKSLSIFKPRETNWKRNGFGQSIETTWHFG
ncbi:MAG: hypothetical protein COB66_07735 [Coxiella sp. (in: Bacteria)]|nr:MAG: hypothetical protein COB66_07735 [Coxiella sp. (in: g-proteobacteria)]